MLKPQHDHVPTYCLHLTTELNQYRKGIKPINMIVFQIFTLKKNNVTKSLKSPPILQIIKKKFEQETAYFGTTSPLCTKALHLKFGLQFLHVQVCHCLQEQPSDMCLYRSPTKSSICLVTSCKLVPIWGMLDCHSLIAQVELQSQTQFSRILDSKPLLIYVISLDIDQS